MSCAVARGSREAWEDRVEQWRKSGLTAAAFAAELGIKPATLSWWKWKLGRGSVRRRRRASAGTTISPLTFVEMTAPTEAGALEILFPDGVRVRVPSGYDSVALAHLIEALGTRR